MNVNDVNSVFNHENEGVDQALTVFWVPVLVPGIKKKLYGPPHLNPTYIS